METPGTEVSIRPMIERTPFEDALTQDFFTKWCDFHDSFTPSYVSREEWGEHKKNGILQKRPDNKSILFIPKDLKLWEMIDVVEAVDRDTFSQIHDKRPDRRRKLYDLGDSVINVSIYLVENLESLREGKEIAEETAKDLYRYGNALRTGNYDEETTTEAITSNHLSDKQKDEIDKLFGVDKLAVFKKQGREQTRTELLKQYFKTAEKAKVSETHHRAIKRSQKRVLENPINQPEQELHDVILRQASEKMLSDMGKEGWKDEIVKAFKELGIDLEGQRSNLLEVLEISKLRDDLQSVRKTGDAAKISDKERKIASLIQNAVSKISYEEHMPSPSKTIRNQNINCVRASMIGSQLLQDVGLHYLVGTLPEHSVTFLITTDNRVFWQDFLNPEHNFEITDASGYQEVGTGKLIKAEDIVDLSKSYHQGGLLIKRGKKQPVSVLSPETGLKSQILTNIGKELLNEGTDRLDRRVIGEAIALFKYAETLDNKDYNVYVNMGLAYQRLLNYQMAYTYERKALELFPEGIHINFNLGILLTRLGRKDEASKLFEKVIQLSQESKDYMQFAEQARKYIAHDEN